ncbi:MAG: acyl--CoA ligase [Planktomarina sp.]|nr:acyl--CoA ligase [Planktomarina sp.]
MQRLEDLIQHHPDTANAIGAPGRDWMTYGDLKVLTLNVRQALRAAGISAQDRVAIVLPNGPEMAAAFVTVAQSTTTAPLNLAYKEDEFAFYLKDLKAKAIIVETGYDGPARSVAKRFDMIVIELTATDPAGSFTLSTTATGNAADTLPVSDDVALILHTSGTTSRPKIVPLLQSNVAASAQNVMASLALTSDDCCLNVMPLFHIHGLIAAVSGSLAAGASISCAPGFDALKFYGWLEEVDPSWYTAVPTMHQAILARAPRNAEIIKNARLRFLRSSSSSLPGPVMTELAETFGAPVVEAYGMTEAAHQMCCNPIEPGRQKPGAVGLPAGPVVRIAHEIENRLIDGVGEISISGLNVTPGYEANPEANKKNFFEADGKRWFRTGDQGRFDEDGFLSLTGRLKEIINRGGEKISPLEVDGILSDHPAVGQCVTFAVPHAKLGEDVGAAVVLKEGQSATDREIRDFASQRLAAFKVPRKILILDEIPKGATGKLQRIGLAEKLGLG